MSDLGSERGRAVDKEYCYWHSPEHIWPEIPEGIRAVGILNMEIYRLGTRLFMIVETPDDFDWDASFARLATMDKQAEWEDFVAKYQKAVREVPRRRNGS